ncbi:MAG TPA: molybdopterin-guanine dinucleotide biosynthesis protein B [Burkholderiaceae bacterium]|nr:molybdopterin-guanine dinucleotide biosynthesis protein B [Burkholderiaceae bacterium]
MKAIGFIGYSNSGKTTLIEKLIPIFRKRGLVVSAVKNAHHGFDMDRPGKDSFRYRESGAQQVLIATGSRWALLSETPQRAATLDELLSELAPCDLVIVEGFKSEGHIPRIEVRRLRDNEANNEPPIFLRDSNVVALAADHAIDTSLPVLDLNDPDKIAAFITQILQLPAPSV